jgi:membrane-associated phospholipid phosphatase
MSLTWRAVLLSAVLLMVDGATSSVCSATPQGVATDPAVGRAGTPDAKPQGVVLADKPSAKEADDPYAYDNSLGPRFIGHLARDQVQIWTFPARLRLADLDWVMPFVLTTTASLATDTEFSKHLSSSPSRTKYSNDFANFGIGAMGGMAGGLWLWGEMSHDDHKRETGMLAGEAALDSLAVVYALKYSFGRERPLQDNFQGKFFSGGDSFPSEHAAAAWSVATVVAHEYPGALTRILAYGMATAISASRLEAKQHFPSDVLIGSAIGWFSGEVVYRLHHDPELSGSTWPTYSQARSYLEEQRPRRNMGTAFVELDSWVYPAMDRLAGLGYVHTAVQGLRPWTRMRVALLIEEASENLEDREIAGDGAAELVMRLRSEFAYELERIDGGRNLDANLESAYTRTVSISGPALTDGFHFGQTVSYDFGRPFERGTNLQEGGAFRAEAGPISIYVRAEYQHAPGAPAPSEAVLNIIATRDMIPEAADMPVNAINQPQLLDAYVAVNVSNWQILAGRQSLSWGPGPGGSLLLSDNAPPIDMVRMVNSEPERLPGVLKYLGPVTIDQFLGRLESSRYIHNPFMYGNKISLKPFPNFEFGFERTVTIGGKGPGANPLTPGNFLDSFFGRGSGAPPHSVPGNTNMQLDWTFNVPHVGNYLVLYGEWYADDDPLPFFAPSRTAFRPGFYITHFPGIPKLDFHFETANTTTSVVGAGEPNIGDLNYWNFGYREGYTNNGFLLGNTVGRLGETYQGWLTYTMSPRDTLQVTYKNSGVGSAFIPGGGAWQDYGVKSEIYLNSGMYLKTQVQYEHISHFPILFNGPQKNVTAILEFGFSPDSRRR